MNAFRGIDSRRQKPAHGGGQMSLATVDSAAKPTPRTRNAHDFYSEPAWAVEGLLDAQRFSGLTLDPACGRGTIPIAFRERDMDCAAADIVDRSDIFYGDFHQGDFLAVNASKAVANIVCNPPFNLAEPFLRKALDVASHKVAFLLRLSWLEGRARRWVYDQTPLAAVHPFAARVSMPPGDSDVVAKGGAVAFAWFVWDHSHPIGAPAMMRRIERGPK
jgi:hypothetical protein